MPDGSMGQIGGRAVYPNKHETGDHVVSSLSGVQSALDSASNGEVVFIEGSANIQSGEGDIFVPSGVTLASDRGVGTSDGARIYTNDRSDIGIVTVSGTLEGVEVEGAIPDFVGYVGGNDVDYPVGRGVEMGNGGEIANCHLHHFGSIVGVDGASDAHIHHCEVDHAAVEGLGYGIVANSSGGRVVIEYNFMHTCRHEIAAHGGAGYVLRHNVFGEDRFEQDTGSLHQQEVDDHGVGLHTVRNNEFRQTGEIFSFRDGTESGSECYRNWFWDSSPTGLGEFPGGNVYENHFGPSDPPEGVGANYDDVSEPPPDPTGTAFEVITPEGGSEVTFSFTSDGRIFRHEVSDTVSSIGENNVSITDNGDGTWTGTGASGNGFGDAFLVDGTVMAYTDNGAERTLRWGGQEVTLGELVGDDDPDPPDDGNGNGDGNGDTDPPDDGNGDDKDDGGGVDTASAGLLLVAGLGYAAYRSGRGRNR